MTNVVWAGTASETVEYHIYRSEDGTSFHIIGIADGGATSFEDNDMHSPHYYYKVTAVNTIPGGETCESAPAMSMDGSHDYVYVAVTGVGENDSHVNVYPNPTAGQLTIEARNMTHIVVMNAVGQVVYDAPVEGDKVLLDLAQYGTGVYMVRIQTANETLVRKVLVAN